MKSQDEVMIMMMIMMMTMDDKGYAAVLITFHPFALFCIW